ncbi:MAG: Hcp family type VI secretion system effector [Thermoplasmatota archaeon]
MVNNIMIGSIIALASVNLLVAGTMAVGLTDGMDLTKEKKPRIYVVEDWEPSERSSWAYIRLEGIEGECSDRGHEGWSELLDFDHPISRTVYGVGDYRNEGRVEIQDLTVVKELDKASPKLAEAICNGTEFDSVEIHFTAVSGDDIRQTYFAYELTDVIMSSYEVSNSGEDETVLIEEITLDFEEIKISYTSPGDDDGAISMDFNWTRALSEYEY